MKSPYKNLTTYVVVFLGIISTFVISGDQEKSTITTEDPRNVPGHGSLEKEEMPTSEEEDLDKEIADEHTQTCVELLVDCWLFYNRTKPYLKERHRERICYRRIHEFPVCAALDHEDVKNAKQLADAHLQEEIDKKFENAERRRRLQELREEWEDIRDSVTRTISSTPAEIEETTEFNSTETDNYQS